MHVSILPFESEKNFSSALITLPISDITSVFSMLLLVLPILRAVNIRTASIGIHLYIELEIIQNNNNQFLV